MFEFLKGMMFDAEIAELRRGLEVGSRDIGVVARGLEVVTVAVEEVQARLDGSWVQLTKHVEEMERRREKKQASLIALKARVDELEARLVRVEAKLATLVEPPLIKLSAVQDPDNL